MTTEFRTNTYESMACGKCGIKFLVPDFFKKERHKDQGDWYCPNGHSRHFIGETETEKLRGKLDRAERRERRVEAERDGLKFSVRAHKGANTRLKNRIANGVCPCCSRSFSNLRRHISKQHPEYACEKK